MAHNLLQDTMAFVGAPAWHGLGRRVPSCVSAAEMIQAANLDWKVRKEPALGARMVDRTRSIYSRYAILRSRVGRETTDVQLAVVGGEYQPLQNADAFRFFEPFIDAKWADFHTAGALGDGERVWVLAKLAGDILIGKSDAIERFLLLSNTHDGSGAVTVRFTPIRVVCQNTLNYAMTGGKSLIAIRHTRNIHDNLAKAQAAQLKKLVDRVFGDAQTLFGRMAMRKIQIADIDRYLNLLFPKTKTQKAKGTESDRRARIKTILDDKTVTPEESRNSLWGLYNAVVRDEDFRASRKANADARLERVWFGPGQDLKLKALKIARAQLRLAA